MGHLVNVVRVDVGHYHWDVVVADGYIDVRNTFSGHIAMQRLQRERLCTEIRRRLAERLDGRLRRHSKRPPHRAYVRNALGNAVVKAISGPES